MPVGLLRPGRLVLSALLMLAALAAGARGVACAGGDAVPATAQDATRGVANGATHDVAPGPARAIEVYDDLGHHLILPRPPQRIVSLSPSLTEVLFGLGCDSTRIAGVTSFCDYPPAAQRIARVGGIVDPSLETILLLKPDLVLATRGNPREFMESLGRLGIPVYAVEDRGDLARIFENITRLGDVLGCEREAQALCDALRERLEAVRRVTDALPAQRRPRVYFGELEGALWTAGPGSHVDGIIAAAGGTNIAADAPSAWCPLSLEAVLARDPEVCFGTFRPNAGSNSIAAPDAVQETHRNPRDVAEERISALLRSHEAWRASSLGRRPRVFLVEEDRILRPAPRVFDVLEEFARFLHPELFASGRAEEVTR